MNFKEKLIERFLKYVSFETTSDEFSETCPSTKLQLNLAEYLVDEMKKMGIESQMDENGYVYGKIPATDKTLKKVGFIAHMDTSPDFTGKNVKAQRFVYEGGDIKLNENLFMNLKEFPFLKNNFHAFEKHMSSSNTGNQSIRMSWTRKRKNDFLRTVSRSFRTQSTEIRHLYRHSLLLLCSQVL